MADVNVIKSQSGFNFKMPQMNFSPKVAIVATVLLAVLAVGGAAFLLRAPKESFNATTTGASTTTTISDNFNAANLDTTKWTATGGGTATLVGGKLKIDMPLVANANAGEDVVFNTAISGDFQLDIDGVSFENNSTGVGDFTFGLPNTAIYWEKTATKNFIYLEDGQGTARSNARNLQTSGPIALRLTRVGNVTQAFIKTATDYELIGSSTGTTVEQGKIKFTVYNKSGGEQENSQAALSATVDNFSGRVNLAGGICGGIAGLACPAGFDCVYANNCRAGMVCAQNIQPDASGNCVPHVDLHDSVAACTLSFNVLTVVPTPTPFPTPTPTPTPTTSPTPTPTPTTTPTPTPSGTPNSCNGTCGSNANCQDGMVCDLTSGRCRNPSCLTASSCSCGTSSTPTPTPFTTSGPTPTPVTHLEEAGSVSGTWAITLAGSAMLILGAIVAFAL